MGNTLEQRPFESFQLRRDNILFGLTSRWLHDFAKQGINVFQRNMVVASLASGPTHNVVLEELNENEGSDAEPDFEQLEDLVWANREKAIKRREKRKLWKDMEVFFSNKPVKSSKSKKEGGRRRVPKEVEVVENEEMLIAIHNEILKGKNVLTDSLEARARRVWNIGKQVGLRSKGLEEATVNRLKLQLSEQQAG